jgi:dTDP-4-amino-4,6-dideoxygalactose transaminase
MKIWKGKSLTQISDEIIPILKSDLPRPEKWLSYLELAYRNSKFSNFGEVSHLVEQRVAEFLGIPPLNVVTCVNATQALTGAISTAAQNQLRWTVPSWTFTATPASMISANQEFFFSDIDDDWRIALAEPNVNVVDVLPFGEGVDITRLENLCTGEIVIDGAASFDALRFSELNSIKRRFALVVSFHPTKFPAGPEGAVFISNDPSWCEKFRYWTIFGMDEKRESFFPGTNAKINEFSSAVILASLDAYQMNRSNLMSNLERGIALASEAQLEVNSSMENGFATPYWIIKAEENKIKKIVEVFENLAISTRRWWMYGCHNMQAYQNIPKVALDKTESASKCSIGLPMFIGMNEKEWERISAALKMV